MTETAEHPLAQLRRNILNANIGMAEMRLQMIEANPAKMTTQQVRTLFQAAATAIEQFEDCGTQFVEFITAASSSPAESGDAAGAAVIVESGGGGSDIVAADDGARSVAEVPTVNSDDAAGRDRADVLRAKAGI